MGKVRKMKQEICFSGLAQTKNKIMDFGADQSTLQRLTDDNIPHSPTGSNPISHSNSHTQLYALNGHKNGNGSLRSGKSGSSYSGHPSISQSGQFGVSGAGYGSASASLASSSVIGHQNSGLSTSSSSAALNPAVYRPSNQPPQFNYNNDHQQQQLNHFNQIQFNNQNINTNPNQNQSNMSFYNHPSSEGKNTQNLNDGPLIINPSQTQTQTQAHNQALNQATDYSSNSFDWREYVTILLPINLSSLLLLFPYTLPFLYKLSIRW
jgi:hypothetical protein